MSTPLSPRVLDDNQRLRDMGLFVNLEARRADRTPLEVWHLCTNDD